MQWLPLFPPSPQTSPSSPGFCFACMYMYVTTRPLAPPPHSQTWAPVVPGGSWVISGLRWAYRFLIYYTFWVTLQQITYTRIYNCVQIACEATKKELLEYRYSIEFIFIQIQSIATTDYRLPWSWSTLDDYFLLCLGLPPATCQLGGTQYPKR